MKKITYTLSEINTSILIICLTLIAIFSPVVAVALIIVLFIGWGVSTW